MKSYKLNKRYINPVFIIALLTMLALSVGGCAGFEPGAPPKSPEEAVCPDRCVCLTEREAVELGLKLCNDEKIVCGRDAAGNLKYCWEKPYEETQCPTECICLTEVEAKRLGFRPCNDKLILCGRDPTGAPKYCFEKPAD